MLKGFLDVFILFFNFLKYPIFICFGIMILFYLCIIFFIVLGFVKGKRFKKGLHNKIKKRNFFLKIFVDLPKQIAEDRFAKNPEYFNHSGLIIFEGRQGRGKTIAMCQCAMTMQQEYPKSLCLSNLSYKFQDVELDDWHKLIDFKNGIYGVIAMIDETQNWFSSNQSKNFPPEMLEVITQNRKNRRVILGTAQNFYLLSKAIRSQATEVRRCATIFGACTIVRKFYPVLDSEGNVTEWKRRGMYFFVHNKKLRECYDTYHVIHSLSKSGFQEKIYIKNDEI